MTHTLPTVGLLCLYGLSAPAVSQWHIRYDGDVPAPTAENRATIARLDILLPHYRHNRSIRLHFDFHNRDRQQAEIRWQALKRQLPALAVCTTVPIPTSCISNSFRKRQRAVLPG